MFTHVFKIAKVVDFAKLGIHKHNIRQIIIVWNQYEVSIHTTYCICLTLHYVRRRKERIVVRGKTLFESPPQRHKSVYWGSVIWMRNMEWKQNPDKSGRFPSNTVRVWNTTRGRSLIEMTSRVRPMIWWRQPDPPLSEFVNNIWIVQSMD